MPLHCNMKRDITWAIALVFLAWNLSFVFGVKQGYTQRLHYTPQSASTCK